MTELPTLPTATPAPRPPARPEPSPRSRLRALLRLGLNFALGAVFGALLMVFVLRVAGEHGLAVPAATLLALLVSGWLQLVVHEAGHAIAGVAVGLRPVALGVGPLRMERGAGRWQLRRVPAIAGIGGFALLLPQGADPSPRAQVLYILGGPLANLLLALLVVLPILLLPLSGPVAAAGLSFAAVGALIGLVNLLPFTTASGWSSDGRQLWSLWRGGREAEATQLMLRLSGMAMLGERPRDWPALDPSLADDPALPAGHRDALRRVLLLRASDRKSWDEPAAHAAAAALAVGFWSAPEGQRPLSALSLADWALHAHADLDAAEAWLAHTGGAFITIEPALAAIRAAIALERGERAEAMRQIAAARAGADRLPDPASRSQLAEELGLLERRLTRVSPPVAPGGELAKSDGA